MLQFTLPTKTVIKVYINDDVNLNVNIDPSPADIHNTEGLCGTIGGDKDLPFMLRGGSFTADKDDFFNSWQVTRMHKV